ncbi:hypothetical protein CEN39_16665 [Fischerella thermalis CCMEE 5201]|jgi:hypothetical protein|nr:hypothetical protein CEN39_16665 [Fischerella thermalis CCMEE 5201]
MKPLNEILTRYPSFQPNQVLTSNHLNDLANYLEQQHRLTRQKLIGIGIVCGLQVDLDRTVSDIKINISPGVGITSEGYLIILEKTVCTHVRPFKDKAAYQPFINPVSGEPYEIQEILTDPGETNDTTITKLSDKDIINKIVVLYLEILEKATNKCLDEDCDEKGKLWEFTVKKLLINSEVMASIIRRLHTIPSSSKLEEYFNPEYELANVEIERFGYKQVAGQFQLVLSDIQNLNDFVRGYDAAIFQGGLRLARAIHRLYILYKPLFDLQLGSTTNPFPGYELAIVTANTFTVKLRSIINNSRLTVQYIYDWILDLQATYEELSCKLFDLTSDCCPNPNLFPQHLMLGELQDHPIGQFDPNLLYPPSVFRHHFISAPIYNYQSDLLLSIQQLMQRLVLMIQRFTLDGLLDNKTPLKITPSKDCTFALGRQAIPFYYKIDDEKRSLLNYWDFETSKRNWTKSLLGYHNSQFPERLLYDICEYPKLRIEGHVGKNLKQAITELQDLRTKYNLTFDIIALKLDPTFDSVYLPDDSKIADLQILYLTERNELVCCLRDFIHFLETDPPNTTAFIVLWFLYSIYGSDINPTIAQQIYLLFLEFYQLYINTLKELANELPLNIKQFNFNEFKNAYDLANSMSILIKYFINTWGDVESFLNPRRGEEIPDIQFRQQASDILSIFLNAFELFLDKLLDDCLQARFETIYNLFIERVENISLFSSFAQKVPGMEHIAGVTKGGTFILVYEDITQSRTITGVITDNENRPLAGVRVRIVAKRTPFTLTDNEGKFTLQIPEGFRGLTLTKPGYYAGQVTLKDGSNVVTARLTPAGKQPAPTTTAETPINNLFNNYVSLFNRIQEISNIPLEAFNPINARVAAFVDKVIDFNFADTSNFRVVGDFYLPNQIPSHYIEAFPMEVCPPEGKDLPMDIQAIAAFFFQLTTQNQQFANFVRTMGLKVENTVSSQEESAKSPPDI